MNKTITYTIFITLILAGIVLLLINTSDDYDPPYIQPTEFNVGKPERSEVYKSSNLCDDTVLKPIIPVSVDYGSEMPTNCGCTKYLEPP